MCYSRLWHWSWQTFNTLRYAWWYYCFTDRSIDSRPLTDSPFKLEEQRIVEYWRHWLSHSPIYRQLLEQIQPCVNSILTTISRILDFHPKSLSILHEDKSFISTLTVIMLALWDSNSISMFSVEPQFLLLLLWLRLQLKQPGTRYVTGWTIRLW